MLIKFMNVSLQGMLNTAAVTYEELELNKE